MSYKFVKITSFYKNYLEYYYSKNENEKNLSYTEQYNHLMEDSFSWADYFQKNFAKINIEAHEIIINAFPLQKAWADENGFDAENKNIVMHQLSLIKPDIVFIQDSNSFNGEWVNFIKSKVPSIKKVIGWRCHPFSDYQIQLFEKFDFMLTCSPAFAEILKSNGIKTYIFYHAFEPEILNKIDPVHNETNDFIFIGSLLAGEDYHSLRLSIIESLIKSGIKLDLYSNLIFDNPLELLKKKTSFFAVKYLGLGKFSKYKKVQEIALLKEFPQNPGYSNELKNIAKKPIYGLEMFQALMNSRITLNVHGGIAGNYAANMRLFEATGVGSCLLTDRKKNLGELFAEGEEVVSFSSAEECIEKTKWLLNNPSEREKISRAGQIKTLTKHTFEERIKLLDEIILNELKNC